MSDHPKLNAKSDIFTKTKSKIINQREYIEGVKRSDIYLQDKQWLKKY